MRHPGVTVRASPTDRCVGGLPAGVRLRHPAGVIVRRDFLGIAATAALSHCAPPTVRESRGHAPRQAPIAVRASNERGHADHGWLRSQHSFSFARYRDPAWMGFRNLRVINEDFIARDRGFPTHPHRDMEIVTYLLDGGLEHRDTLGNGGVIVPGRAQRMSAGTGIQHSEYARLAEAHLLQIWIEPASRGIQPGYEEQPIHLADLAGGLVPLAAPPGEPASVAIHADARIFSTRLERGATRTHEVRPGRAAWAQVARGSVRANGTRLQQGDAAYTLADGVLVLDEGEDAEVLLFDLG